MSDDNLEAAMDKVAETTSMGVSSNVNATSDQPANKQVMIRATEFDHSRWKDAAENKGVSLSEFIRETLNRKAEELLDCNHPYPYRKTYPWSEMCLKCGVRLRG